MLYSCALRLYIQNCKLCTENDSKHNKHAYSKKWGVKIYSRDVLDSTYSKKNLSESPSDTVTNTARIDVENEKRGGTLAATTPAQVPADPGITGVEHGSAPRGSSGILRARSRHGRHVPALEGAEVGRGREEAAVAGGDASGLRGVR